MGVVSGGPVWERAPAKSCCSIDTKIHSIYGCSFNALAIINNNAGAHYGNICKCQVKIILVTALAIDLCQILSPPERGWPARLDLPMARGQKLFMEETIPNCNRLVPYVTASVCF